MAAVGKSGPFWVDTLANLKLLGTDDTLKVGDPAWDTTNSRTIYCLTAAASSSTWAYKQTVTYNSEAGWTGDTNIRYMPFTSDAESTSIAGARVGLALPYAGRVLRATLNQHSGTVMGSTDITTHVSATGAPPSTTPTETENVNIVGLDATHTVNFTTSTFVADGRLVIGVNPTADPVAGFTMMTLVVEYTIPV